MGRTQQLGNYVNGIFQDASNNIGIGGSPSGSYKFEVTGSGRFSGALTGTSAIFAGSVKSDGVSSEGKFIIERDSVATNTIIGSLDFTNNNAVTTYGKVFGGRNSAGDGYVALGTGVSNNLYALENGNVGIGTSSPNAKLSLGTGGGTKFLIYDGGFTGSGGNGYFAGFAVDSPNANDTTLLAHHQGALVFGRYTNANDTSAITERMRITSSGVLIVGGTSALIGGGAKTEIQQSGANTNIFLYNSNTADTSNYFVWCNANGLDRMLVYGNGNIVNRNNSYGTLSDIKLKENIVDATPKLEDLLKVKIRNYNLIGEETKQIGVIAQELEEIFPSMIEETEDFKEVEVEDKEGNIKKERQSLGTTTKSVKVSVFVPMLIKALQESHEIIKDLEARIVTLESKIN